MPTDKTLIDELKPELKNYDQLVDAQEKLDQANKILAKVMQIFIADLGLRQQQIEACRIDTRTDNAAAELSQAPSSVKAEAAAQFRAETSKAEGPKSNKAGKNEKAQPPTRSKAQVVSTKQARGAVHALYQAILWREPDPRGETNATIQFSHQGWGAYIRGAREMVRSEEFLRDIEPQYSPNQIINRMYSVYLGRCANDMEIKNHLKTLNSGGSTKVIEDVITKGRSFNEAQIFEGGFSPSSCSAT